MTSEPMTIGQAIDLLTIAASYDRRTIGEADARAWHAVLGDLVFADARAAVIAHYGRTRDWIMPADIRQGVKSIRNDRIARSVIPAPPAELADDPAAYRAALAAEVKRAGDGELTAAAPRLAIAGGPPAAGRKPGPPVPLRNALGEFRRTLGPARPRRVTAMHPQDMAAQQAAEARTDAERDLAGGEAP